MKDKIIPFTPAAAEPAVKLIQSDYKECKHTRFEVHRDQPLVFCRDCDAPVDPVFALRRIAESHAQREYMVRQWKQEAERLERIARRTQTTRRNPRLAEGDARHIQHYQEVQARPLERFPGDVTLTDQEDVVR